MQSGTTSRTHGHQSEHSVNVLLLLLLLLLLPAGRSPRDVQTIGYAFKVGKVTPAESALLKLYDEFSIEAHGSRSTADVAYRYFSVRPTGISEHYAKS